MPELADPMVEVDPVLAQDGLDELAPAGQRGACLFAGLVEEGQFGTLSGGGDGAAEVIPLLVKDNGNNSGSVISRQAEVMISAQLMRCRVR
ncbi:hypothetical protein [Nocardia sp. NPDC059228]|uniref:hypothetical protein n=1 Tax=Nocardia sp. NPDC059228 TaxID=3346777 RepID=UPI0036965BA7